MPGAGRSDSLVASAIGATVALVAVVSYLIFGWSFNDAANTTSTAIGIIVAASAVGLTLYSRLYSDGDRNNG